MNRIWRNTVLLLMIVVAGGCGSGDPPGGGTPVPSCAAKPPGGVLGTFSQTSTVLGKQFYWISITDPAAITDAIARWKRRSTTNIPAGNIICEPIAWNCGWSWHEDPPSVRIADAAIELCDGAAPQSADECASFSQNTRGQFCPWGAKLEELRDCRTDPQCPLISR